MEKLKTGLISLLAVSVGNGDFTAFKSAAALVGGFIVAKLGGADPLLKAMAVAVVIDYLVGVAKAIIQKELSSAIGARGIAKKILYFLVVALAYLLEQVTNGVIQLREVTIMFYLCNEGISILENVIDAGVPFPPKIKDILIQLKGKDENNG